MAGFRLDNGTDGCPPSATPPSGYKNPFRFDSAGRLWITGCFQTFTYFGEARQDLTAFQQISADRYDGAATNYLRNGTIKTRTITNATQCTMAILLGHDIVVDLQTREDHFVGVTLNELWNGTIHSSASVTSQYNSGSTAFVRALLHSGAVPHDVNAPNGGSTLQLAPGASATVGARVRVGYYVGSPVTGDQLLLSSAVRIYGYTLG